MIEAIFFNPWIWIIPILLAIAIAATIAGAFALADDFTVFGPIGVCLGGVAVLFLAPFYFGFMLPPYDASFYQTYRVTGEVLEVESAFSGDEGTMSQVFIARVGGIDLFVRSDDQRFRTVRAGDDINLVCTKGFEYFQEPWLECAFGAQS